MVWLPLALSASFLNVGYTEDGSLKRNKLQQYFYEALSLSHNAHAGGSPGSPEGNAFGSPLPSQECPPVLDPSDPLDLVPSVHWPDYPAQHAYHHRKQPCSAVSNSSSSSSVRHGKYQPSSPAAIISPRTGSEPSTEWTASPCGTASSTPEACSTLAQALIAAAATPPTPLAHQTPPSQPPAHGLAGPSRQTGVFTSSGKRLPCLREEQESEWEGEGEGTRTTSQPSPSGQLPARLGSTGAGRRAAVEVQPLLLRLKESNIRGKVCAWGWEQAALLSTTRRSMPAELFAALWCAVEACEGRCSPQDVLGMLGSWLSLMHTCPRHFQLRVAAVESLVAYSIPPAVKRMDEKQLAQVASLCNEIALHRCEGGPLMQSGVGASARDLMQPIFGLVVAEAAWRCSSQLRYVSLHTLHTLDQCSHAWRWGVVWHRDPPQLAALKQATAQALLVLQGHDPDSL